MGREMMFAAKTKKMGSNSQYSSGDIIWSMCMCVSYNDCTLKVFKLYIFLFLFSIFFCSYHGTMDRYRSIYPNRFYEWSPNIKKIELVQI